MGEQEPTQNDPARQAATLDYSSPRHEKMDATARKRQRGILEFTWWELIIIAAIIVVLIAILLPALPSRESGTLRVKCLSQLRQIGSALALYAQQNNDVYPPRLVDLCNLRIPAKMLVCPTSKTEIAAREGATPQQTITTILAGGNHVSYVYLIGGMHTASLKPGAVAAYEAPGNHGSKSAGSGNVLFVDGHATSIPVAQLQQMIKEVNAGQNPPPAVKGN
jgi:prepilin-type processing-associated H-X9-DG protein